MIYGRRRFLLILLVIGLATGLTGCAGTRYYGGVGFAYPYGYYPGYDYYSPYRNYYGPYRGYRAYPYGYRYWSRPYYRPYGGFRMAPRFHTHRHR